MRIMIIIISVFCFARLSFSEVINKIVAVVNGEVITEADLANYVRKIVGTSGDKNLDKTAKDKLWKKSLENLIEDRLILSFGERSGLKVERSKVEKRITAIKKNFSTEAEFLQALENDGLSYQGLYQRIYNDILKKMVVELFVKKGIEVHPQELRKYYDAHPQEFLRPARVKARKIYIDKKSKDAQERIKQIEGLLHKGVSFEKLAQNHSDSVTLALNYGEWIDRGMLKKDIEGKIFALNVGQISPIIATETGYYIFQILDKQPPARRSFEEVKDKVYEAIYKKKFKERFHKFIEKLKKDAQIEIKR